MTEPFRLSLPVIRLPPNKGGGRGVFLWGEVATGSNSGYVRSTVMTDKGKVIQFFIPQIDITEVMRKPTSFIEVPDMLAPNAALYDANGSVARKIKKDGGLK